MGGHGAVVEPGGVPVRITVLDRLYQQRRRVASVLLRVAPVVILGQVGGTAAEGLRVCVACAPEAAAGEVGDGVVGVAVLAA